MATIKICEIKKNEMNGTLLQYVIVLDIATSTIAISYSHCQRFLLIFFAKTRFMSSAEQIHEFSSSKLDMNALLINIIFYCQ